MLQMTDAAETALRRIRLESDVPQDATVRIGPISTGDGVVGIGFAFTDGPQTGDQKISVTDDFQVYLAPELAGRLQQAALEVTADMEGITLQLRTQDQLNGSTTPRLPGGP
jgi:Fe-S cluster assembly iron-binding protein IscA